MAVEFTADSTDTDLSEVVLSWEKTDDPIEPTAKAEGYILQTRVDDGAFDNGIIIDEPAYENGRLSTTLRINPGHIYSYRITAWNKGGKSFASETVSVGIPHSTDSCKLYKKILVVNNFDRVSGPAFIDTENYAGFLNDKESGVPMHKDISFTGAMYDFDRQSKYTSDTNPGFGASYCDNFGEIIAGNTFDYAYPHGKALLEAGYPFSSCSKEVFCSDSTLRNTYWTADLICGKQVTTIMPDGSEKFQVFPYELQNAIRNFTERGGNLIVSGAYIGTDIWDQIYPYEKDKTSVAAAKKFVQNTLGFKWAANSASRKGVVRYLRNDRISELPEGSLEISNEINSKQYCVESPDGILPGVKSATSFMRYADSGISAGICNEGKGYRTVCLGFPIEALTSEDKINEIMELTLEFFSR
jgi:hypothetical protein